MTRANLGARPGHGDHNGFAARLFRMATLVWTIVIAWLAFRPATGPDAGLPWDKANHALAFLVLTVLVGRGWPRLTAPVVALIMLAAGVAIELVQGLPAIGRDADLWDVVADAVGTGVGLGVLAWLARLRG